MRNIGGGAAAIVWSEEHLCLNRVISRFPTLWQFHRTIESQLTLHDCSSFNGQAE